MTLEEAIRTALEVEHRVRDRFRQLADQASGDASRAFFTLMAGEEEGHVAYLEAALARWRAEGVVEDREIASSVRREWVREGVHVLREAKEPKRQADPHEHLSVALRLEHEVSDLYRRLVAEVEDPRAQRMFRRFLEIEDGHTALVQAELDYELHTGNFFDVREFTLDG